MGTSPSRSGLRRQLTWLDATAIYVGIILGSGIFIAPSAVAAATGSLFVAAGVWIAAAVVAACGAFCYAECGARLPATGGFYVYFRRAFGEPVAFIGGWAALLITYPASLAAIALIFARYLAQLLPLEGDIWVSVYATAGLSLAALFNGVGVRAGANTQRVLTGAKVAALVLLCLAALAGSGARESAPAILFDVAPSGSGALLIAMVAVLWTYDGWSDVTLVGGELEDPGQNLGRTVVVGTIALALVYVLVQLSTMLLLGAEAGHSDQVVADAAQAGLGARVGRFVALLVVISTFGSINGIVLAASRLGFAMANDGVFIRWFSKVSPRFDTPLRSLSVLAVAAVTYVWTAGFQDLLRLFSFNVWIFYGATALALVVLRARRIGEPPSWRAPGGEVAPHVVLATALLMTFSLLVQSPWRSLQGLALLAAGIPVYFAWRIIGRRSNA
jgi:APA family basic amino acid/polyamine antiporter